MHFLHRAIDSLPLSRMARRALLPLALFVLTVVTAAAAEDSSAAISQATRSFVAKKSPNIKKATIKVDKIKGEYARAVISSKGADTVWAYLRRKEGTWTVLSLGTGFGPEYYKRWGIPKQLQLSSVASTTSPGIPDAHATTITLTRNAGGKPIGVEPQGGHFSQVIGPQARTPGEYFFSTYGRKQKDSILAIYATNESRIPLEKPLARVSVSGLKDGVTNRRIRVTMHLTSDRTLSISAKDRTTKEYLTVAPLSERNWLAAKLPMRSSSPLVAGLNPVALGTDGPSQAGSINQFIGVRDAGGIFKPVLYPDDTPATTANKPGTTYFCTSFPGQRTVDLRLFSGDSPYIERTKPSVRYMISGIKPNGRPYNPIKLELRVGPGRSIIPVATEMKTGATLQVEKYSRSGIEQLQSSGQLGQRRPTTEREFNGLIPAAPGG